MLLTIEVREAGKAPKREQVAKPTGEGYVPGNGAPGAKGAPKGQPVRVIKIGRNDPCPCGSGLKWKSVPAPSTTPKEVTPRAEHNTAKSSPSGGLFLNREAVFVSGMQCL